MVHFPGERLKSSHFLFNFLARTVSVPQVGGFNPSVVHLPGERERLQSSYSLFSFLPHTASLPPVAFCGTRPQIKGCSRNSFLPHRASLPPVGGFSPSVVHFPGERLKSSHFLFNFLARTVSVPQVGGFNPSVVHSPQERLQSSYSLFSFLPHTASLPPVGGFNLSVVHFPGETLPFHWPRVKAAIKPGPFQFWSSYTLPCHFSMGKMSFNLGTLPGQKGEVQVPSSSLAASLQAIARKRSFKSFCGTWTKSQLSHGASSPVSSSHGTPATSSQGAGL